MWGIEGLNDKIAENQDIVRMLAAACLTFDEINDRLDSSLYSNEEKIQGVKESIYYISSLFPDSRRLCGIAYFLQEINALLIAIILHWKEYETKQIGNPKAA